MGKTGAKGDSYYGQVATNYQKRRAKQPWWTTEQEEMHSLLKTLPRGLSVLDVPFGTGRFVPFYRENAYSIFGLDASADMLKAAQSILGPAYEHCTTSTGSATSLPYPDASFDLVSSVRFIRDIIIKPDAVKAMQEFARVSRKYAIIQLGQHSGTGSDVLADLDDTLPLHSQLSAAGNTAMLQELGFGIVDKRLVKSDPDDASEVYHFLLEKR
ncbi:MAG: class I SAM-dependent methyltransferase [Pseudomonadota bacterium]